LELRILKEVFDGHYSVLRSKSYGELEI
jgi:hypothetical protein